MKIKNMTRHDAMNLMGGTTTEGEADAMLAQLRQQERWADTADIPESAWCAMIQQSVTMAAE
jgi:hypothetical protein